MTTLFSTLPDSEIRFREAHSVDGTYTIDGTYRSRKTGDPFTTVSPIRPLTEMMGVINTNLGCGPDFLDHCRDLKCNPGTIATSVGCVGCSANNHT
jgi:hypothetical protein